MLDKKLLITILTVIVIAAGGFWIWQKRQVVEVKAGQVKKENLVSTVTASGETNSSQKETIYAPLTGTLLEIMLIEGAMVEKGEVIARYDKTSFEIAKNQAWAAYTAAKAAKEQAFKASPLFEEFQAAKAASDSTQFNWEQTQKTYNDNPADTNKSALNAAYANYQAAWSQVKRLQNQMINELQIQSLQAQEYASLAVYQKSQSDLEKIEIKASQNGVLIYAINPTTNQKIAAGQAASTGQALFSVADLQRIEFMGKLDEIDLGKVQIGQKAQVNFDAYENQTFLGSVSFIAPAAQVDLAGNRSFQIKIELKNLSFPLNLGLSGNAKIEVAIQENVLVVPQEALFFEKNADWVWVIEKEKVKRKKVKVGEEVDDVIEIVDGVKESELIVIEPVEKLKEGQRVKMTNDQ